MGSSTENSAFGTVGGTPRDPTPRARTAPAAGPPARSRPGFAPWGLGSDTGGLNEAAVGAVRERRPPLRRTARSLATASSPSRRASTRSAPSRRPCAMSRCLYRIIAGRDLARLDHGRPSPTRSSSPTAESLDGLQVGGAWPAGDRDSTRSSRASPPRRSRRPLEVAERAGGRGGGVRPAALVRLRPCPATT